MIDRVSLLLLQLLDQNIDKGFSSSGTIDYSYEHPSTIDIEGNTTGNPLLNIFLYDIRENEELRSNEMLIAKSLSDATATIEYPRKRVDVMYLITAWCPKTTDYVLMEHSLLGQITSALSKYPVISQAMEAVIIKRIRDEGIRSKVSEFFKSQEYPLQTNILDSGCGQSTFEFWSSLGVKMRPAVITTVTFTMPSAIAPETGKLVTHINNSIDFIKTIS